jgi:hypothetical protein
MQTDVMQNADLPAKEPGGATFEEYQEHFRNHYHSTYSATRRDYEDYAPAYRLGHMSAADPRYHNHSWEEAEPELRRYWETEHKDIGSWADYGEAVHYAWNIARARTF